MRQTVSAGPAAKWACPRGISRVATGMSLLCFGALSSKLGIVARRLRSTAAATGAFFTKLERMWGRRWQTCGPSSTRIRLWAVSQRADHLAATDVGTPIPAPRRLISPQNRLAAIVWHFSALRFARRIRTCVHLIFQPRCAGIAPRHPRLRRGFSTRCARVRVPFHGTQYAHSWKPKTLSMRRWPKPGGGRHQAPHGRAVGPSHRARGA